MELHGHQQLDLLIEQALIQYTKTLHYYTAHNLILTLSLKECLWSLQSKSAHINKQNIPL